MKPFPWRAGMLTMSGLRIDAVDERGRPYRLEGRGDERREVYGAHPAQPDLTDAATLGALLGVVREALGRPDLFTRPLWSIHTAEVVAWGACLEGEEGWRGPTEGAAIMAAWEAAP